MTLEVGSLDVTYGSDGGSVPWNERGGLLGQDQDGRRTISQTTPSTAAAAAAAAAAEPSVAGLRDRLLREARQERIRCLQVARTSERWRAEDGAAATTTTTAATTSTSDSATQTDPVMINAPASSTARVDPSLAEVWSQSDEESQMEAIRTIQSLSQKCTDTSSSDRRIAELEELLRIERKNRQEIEAAAAQQQKTRAALQEQVLCLEQELDSKESVLQASDQALARGRPGDHLSFTETGLGNRPMQTMPALQQGSLGSSFRNPSPFQRSAYDSRLRTGNRSLSPNAVRMAASEEAKLLAARRQLLERDVQKQDARDPQLSQLLRELRQTQDAPAPDFDQVFSGSHMASFSSTSARDMNLTAPALSFGLRR